MVSAVRPGVLLYALAVKMGPRAILPDHRRAVIVFDASCWRRDERSAEAGAGKTAREEA